MSPRSPLVAALVLTGLVAVGACGSPAGEARDQSPERSRAPAPTGPSSTASTAASPRVPTSTAASVEPTPANAPIRGVDVSHHQGPIDWTRVRADGIDFAYLKATEGSSYTDPTFARHAAAAQSAGIRVGGYHYFSTCSPGAPQGEHFADVLDRDGTFPRMPPAVDLELLGNCDQPPARDELLRQVRAFLEVVERRTGARVVVYSYPDFEESYRFAPELARRQWVRRIGDRPPLRPWWIWQRDDAARVKGIEGPVDLNVRR